MKKLSLLLTALALIAAFGAPVLVPKSVASPVYYTYEQFRVKEFNYNSTTGEIVGNSTLLLTYVANETININGISYDCYHIEINGTYQAASIIYNVTGTMFSTKGDTPSLVTELRIMEGVSGGFNVKTVENQTNNPPSLGIKYPFDVGSTWNASWNTTTTTQTYVDGYPTGSTTQTNFHSYNATVIKKLDYTIYVENMSSGERKNMTLEVYNITYILDDKNVQVALYSPLLKTNVRTTVYNGSTWAKIYENYLDGFKLIVIGGSSGGGEEENPETPGETSGAVSSTTWILVGAGVGVLVILAAVVLLLKKGK